MLFKGVVQRNKKCCLKVLFKGLNIVGQIRFEVRFAVFEIWINRRECVVEFLLN